MSVGSNKSDGGGSSDGEVPSSTSVVVSILETTSAVVESVVDVPLAIGVPLSALMVR